MAEWLKHSNMDVSLVYYPIVKKKEMFMMVCYPKENDILLRAGPLHTSETIVFWRQNSW